MRLVPAALLLASVAVYETCARGLQHVGKLHSSYVDVHDRAAAFRVMAANAGKSSSPAGNLHYNSKTKPFYVNGTNIPDVDFDIGESYAGLMPISTNKGETRKLYFWYFPSKNPAASKEVTIWLNGGPGCSSLEGLMQENGPWLWQYGTYKPVPNPWSWTNLTNMLWVEQPVGTGFSQGTPNITTQAELATQFKGFYKNFVNTFDLQNRSLYITGESYAGQYVPHIASSMLDDKNKEYFNVSGIMIYDPSINTDQVMEQVPAPAFTKYWSGLFPFNDTVKAEINRMDQSCGYSAYLNKHLTFPPKGKLPNPPAFSDDCDVFSYIFNSVLDINPCFDIYEVNMPCPFQWDQLGFPASYPYTPKGASIYFDRSEVKKAINAPDVEWLSCSAGNVFNTDSGLDAEAEAGHYSSTTVLPGVIDRVQRTVIAHGLLDMVLLSNGTLLSIQNMTWGGKQGFQKPVTQDFYVPFHDDVQLATLAASGTMGKTRTERKLTWVEVNLSGHMVPQYQPSAAFRHMEFLLGRIPSLTSKQPFTFFDNGLDAQNSDISKRSNSATSQTPTLSKREISQILNDT